MYTGTTCRGLKFWGEIRAFGLGFKILVELKKCLTFAGKVVSWIEVSVSWYISWFPLNILVLN